jgi:hypothetical protein
MPTPELFRFRKIRTFNYPILGANATAPVQTVNFDIKDFLQKETLARFLIRIVGTITVAGAGVGAATGRDTEQLITNVILQTAPSLGIINQNNINGRDFKNFSVFDKGYSDRAAAITDAAGAKTVDFIVPVTLKMPGSINPIEFALPLAAFEMAQLQITVGGRDQLFSGGVNTWDLSGLRIEVWVDVDDGVAGAFHAVEHFVKTFPITATQSDLPLTGLDAGYIYTHLLFEAERDNVRDDTLLNSITIQSAGRVWLPQGEGNAPSIRFWNRETHVNNAAEVLTGLFFIPALRDGMYKRAIDCLDAKLDIKADVTLGGGTVRNLKLYGRRIIPLAINAVGAKAAA